MRQTKPICGPGCLMNLWPIANHLTMKRKHRVTGIIIKASRANNAKPAPVTDLQQSSIENRNQNANLNRKKLAKEEEQVKVVVDSTGSIV